MTHKLSILLVEDEKNICDFISTSLSAQDYRISTAHTGKEALPIITSQCPDLILLDLGLPDMDGMEIIRQVRTWSSVPIIVRIRPPDIRNNRIIRHDPAGILCQQGDNLKLDLRQMDILSINRYQMFFKIDRQSLCMEWALIKRRIRV